MNEELENFYGGSVLESQILEFIDEDESINWFKSNYEINKEYSKSGMSTRVYLCKKKISMSEVVVKEIIINKGEEEFNQKLSELVIMMRLSHPNIVSIRDYYVRITPEYDFIKGISTVKHILYVEMEVAKNNLENYLAESPFPNLRKDLFIIMMKNLVDAITYSHSNKVSHCDIKPLNILLFDDPKNIKRKVFKLADWGSAHFIKSREENTKESNFTHTILFSPPELQHIPVSQIDLKKWDIYSMGLSFLVAAGVSQDQIKCIPKKNDLQSHEKYIKNLIESHITKNYGEIIERKIKQMLKFDPKDRFLPDFNEEDDDNIGLGFKNLNPSKSIQSFYSEKAQNLEALKSMGDTCLSNKEYDKALILLLMASDLVSDVKGKESEETGNLLSKLAICFRELNKMGDFEKYSKLSYEVYKKVLGPSSEKTLEAMFRYGMSIALKVDGLNMMKAALKESKKALGKLNCRTAKFYYLLGDAYEENDKLELAIKYTRNSLEIRKKLLSSHPQTINSYLNLCLFLFKHGKYLESLQTFVSLVEELNQDDALYESKKEHLRNFLESFTGDQNVQNDIMIGEVAKLFVVKEALIERVLQYCSAKLKSQFYFFMVDALIKINEKNKANFYVHKGEKEIENLGIEDSTELMRI